MFIRANRHSIAMMLIICLGWGCIVTIWYTLVKFKIIVG